MTQQEFLEALRACAGEYRWELNGALLRAYTADNACYCPITAVVRAQSGQGYPLAMWRVAAQDHLGLLLPTSGTVQTAADYDLAPEDGDIHALRQALLGAVGLVPDAAPPAAER